MQSFLCFAVAMSCVFWNLFTDWGGQKDSAQTLRSVSLRSDITKASETQPLAAFGIPGAEESRPWIGFQIIDGSSSPQVLCYGFEVGTVALLSSVKMLPVLLIWISSPRSSLICETQPQLIHRAEALLSFLGMMNYGYIKPYVNLV